MHDDQKPKGKPKHTKPKVEQKVDHKEGKPKVEGKSVNKQHKPKVARKTQLKQLEPNVEHQAANMQGEAKVEQKAEHKHNKLKVEHKSERKPNKSKVEHRTRHKHNKHKAAHKLKVQPKDKRHIKFKLLVLFGFIAVFVLFTLEYDKSTFDDEDQDNDIISLEYLDVPPVEKSTKTIPNFAEFEDVTEKKKNFFAYLLPEIRRQNSIVLREREVVLALSNQYSQTQVLSSQHRAVLDKLARKYQLADEESTRALLRELVRRVDIIPPALILVQAANESAWGTSRFAQDGYNFFGLWCFKTGCGFVPNERNDDEVHEVAKFRNLSHAVMTYIRNLNRHYAYADLREIRANLRAKNRPITAEALAQGLQNYSIRGQDYIDEILSMIRVNRKHMNLTS